MRLIPNILHIVLFIYITYTVYTQTNETLKPKSNIFVNNDLILDTLNLDAIESILKCKNLDTKQLTSEFIETDNLALNKITAKNIISPDGNPIQFKGHLKIEGKMNWIDNTQNKLNMSNLEQYMKEDKEEELKTNSFNSFIILDELILNDVLQWKTIYHDNFDDISGIGQFNHIKEYNGWTIKPLESAALDQVLITQTTQVNSYEGLVNDMMINGKYKQEITKNFINLPHHSEILVESQFHFLSPFWKGEAAYMKIDNQIFWIDHHDWADYYDEIDPCKIHLNDYEDYIKIIPVHVISKHYLDEINITFGTTMTEEEIMICENKEQIEKIHVFGLDDFVLSIK